MKYRIILLFFLVSGTGFSQLDRNLVNEFHVSVNRGVGSERNFFGGGLGASHIFKADQALGARIGLEANFFHFWNAGVSGPEFNKYQSRSNQHFNALNISVPFAMQVNFGYSVRYLFEMGAEVGVNATTRYSADIHSGFDTPGISEHLKSTMNLGPFLGINLGAGVRIPFNDAVSLLIKPSVGVQAYLSGFKGDALTSGNGYAKLTLGILVNK